MGNGTEKSDIGDGTSTLPVIIGKGLKQRFEYLYGWLSTHIIPVSIANSVNLTLSQAGNVPSRPSSLIPKRIEVAIDNTFFGGIDS